jgi:hypothetical protein
VNPENSTIENTGKNPELVNPESGPFPNSGIADCHYWMASRLIACLTGSNQELWLAFTVEARRLLLDYERAALAESALASLPHEDGLSVARNVLGAQGSPLPAFLSGMTDARSWAGRATRAELKAYALASFEAMNPGDQAAFLGHITPEEQECAA